MAIGRRRTMIRTASVLLGAIALGVVGASVTLAADHAVSISGFSYSPAGITVAAGDTVTWTNSDAQAHTATANDASWNTGSIANGASGTITFSAAGTFPYHCDIHPEMMGTVTVTAAGGGGGGGATTPPTDALASTVPADAADGPLVALVVLAGFALGGTALLRRLARED